MLIDSVASHPTKVLATSQDEGQVLFSHICIHRAWYPFGSTVGIHPYLLNERLQVIRKKEGEELLPKGLPLLGKK